MFDRHIVPVTSMVFRPLVPALLRLSMHSLESEVGAFTQASPKHSMYAIYADQLGWFEGSMSAYMAYMECLGVDFPTSNEQVDISGSWPISSEGG